MGLINNNFIPTPATAEVEVARIKNTTTNVYRLMEAHHKQAFRLVWENPNFTPQEILASFGTDAVALFQLSYSLQQILKTANPDYNLLIPDHNVTFNEDGTVTVGEKINV